MVQEMLQKKAFALGLIEDGEIWMEMIKSRNLTSYTYDERTADEIIDLIKDSYFHQNYNRAWMEAFIYF